MIDAANGLIRGLASAEGIVLAEIFNGMNNRSLFGLSDRDPLHPNDEGYRVMANIWFGALKQAIPGGGTAVASPQGEETARVGGRDVAAGDRGRRSPRADRAQGST